MNKLFKLFSVLALTASVVFISCKGEQGEQGIPGPAGTSGKDGKDGTNGNANVVTRPLVTITPDKWTKVSVAGVGTASASDEWGGYSHKDETITNEKFVLAYVKSGDAWVALPVMLTKDADGSIERLNFSYQSGQVNFLYRYQTKLFDGITKIKPDSDVTFKYVVVQNSIGAALRKSGINLNDVNAVENFVNGN